MPQPALASVVAYATRFDPQFPRKILGSAKAEIEALAALWGAPLPAEYIGFLEHFGERDGGLKLAFDGSTDLIDLIDYYQDYVRTGEAALPAGCFAIGIDALTEEVIALRGAQVVFVGEGKVRGVYADSLTQLVFRTVSLKVRSQAFAHQKIFLGSPGVGDLAAAGATAQRIGFAAQWFSDSIAFCGELPDQCLHMIGYGGQPLSLHYACQQAEDFEHFDEVVRNDFGFEGHALQES